MKVRMKHAIRGCVGGHWDPQGGQEIEVPEPVGSGLCAKGFADPVAEPETVRAEKRPASKRTEKRASKSDPSPDVSSDAS